MSTVVKDMALTPAVFLRWVPTAFEGLDHVVTGTNVEAGSADKGISLTFEPQPPRVLGKLMVMERAKVTLSFRGYEDAEREAFLAHFFKVYQRGGG